jgi:patatin-related protein
MDGGLAPTEFEATNLLDSGVQEVRLAASFSGGVSLAVWMGGVACELGRLCASSPVAPPPSGGGDRGDEVYRGLLALTRSTPAVDVLAGTSAGGINGAALALALARGGDVAPLRDVWFDHGSLDALLRPVGALDPPSLLLGDDHLGRRLSEAMTEIATKGEPADAPPWTARLRLTVTTTLTTPYGEPDWHDAFGEPIAVNQHLGLMRFGHRDLVADAAVGRLAVAARASASYPGGFEAASIPVGRDDDIEGFPRPSMTDVAQWDGDAWALDGGLLLNEPLEAILDDVYGQPAGSPTRRFLLHITPTPGAPRPSRLAR